MIEPTPEASHSSGNTPSIAAAPNGNTDAVRTTFRNGIVRPNATIFLGFPTLHRAAAEGPTVTASLLTEHGVDLDGLDAHGFTAVQNTQYYGR